MTTLIRDWAAERPELDTWAYRFFASAVELERRLSLVLEPTFDQLGIRGGDYETLGHLRRAGKPYERTPTELSHLMFLTTGAMTRRLDRMERDGYLTREPHGSDRRSVVVRLTPRGITMTDRVVDQIVPLLAELLEPVRGRLDDFETTAGMILERLDHID
ncbi:MarR family winged helix-turn-helix transcriptional regulator [Pseudonocardia sp. KRD291]|uniref:MarR family winged helix-turn-helix transcriptional regulator n=1 Tax=Pseudonocardia sp. KRD291 TaxID=2792007 RepID=UPI001C4A567E|nr:MarR family transcriptional regulator [Pseudonocardia sp. KRD291]MBW0103456.1 MarR family transcriptional regulator [Pseudonocardia sp. KRD291]